MKLGRFGVYADPPKPPKPPSFYFDEAP
jgi:hypothetical protein